MNIYRILMTVFCMTFSFSAEAQNTVQSRIYICKTPEGGIRLQNLAVESKCATRLISVSLPISRTYIANNQGAMPDPKLATGAVSIGLQVSPALQQSRDDSRVRLLMGELAQAQEQKVALTTQSQNSGSARFDGDLRTKMSLVQANIDALKREITRARGSNSDYLVGVLP